MTQKAFQRLHALRADNTTARRQQEQMKPRFERMAGRHENGTAPKAVSAYQLFQTPPAIAEQLVDLLDIGASDMVLEPSAGLGRLLDAIMPRKPAGVWAVEINADCEKELRNNYACPSVKTFHQDFLAWKASVFIPFDAVAMNPPFHNMQDILHIKHAKKFLNHGGRLAAICMDTPHREEALRPLASEWIKLPEASFKDAGTRVGCCMMLIAI